MSKRMQAIENTECLYYEDGRIWQQAYREYDNVQLAEGIGEVKSYYCHSIGHVGNSSYYHKRFATLEELRAELGDLRQWRIKGVEES